MPVQNMPHEHRTGSGSKSGRTRPSTMRTKVMIVGGRADADMARVLRDRALPDMRLVKRDRIGACPKGMGFVQNLKYVGVAAPRRLAL